MKRFLQLFALLLFVPVAYGGPSLGDFWEGKAVWVKGAGRIGADFRFHFLSILQGSPELIAYYIASHPGPDGKAKMTIGRARSVDGIDWTDEGTVLDAGQSASPAQPAWDDRITSFPGIWKDGGTWCLVYEGAGESPGWPGDIGLATSTNGLQFVKYTNNPILRHNPAGWERANIGTPSLYRENGIWYLFYHGYDANVCQISVASGTTLTNLVKLPAPILPVGRDLNAWDSGTTGHRSGIIKEGRYYYMAFEGSTLPPFASARWSSGLARSTNLLSGWTEFPGNPILPQTLTGMGNDGPELMHINGTWFLYVRTSTGTTRWRLGRK